MRRMNRSILGALLAFSLLLAPVTLAGEATSDGLSLIERVQNLLDDLFGNGRVVGEVSGKVVGAGPVTAKQFREGFFVAFVPDLSEELDVGQGPRLALQVLRMVGVFESDGHRVLASSVAHHF